MSDSLTVLVKEVTSKSGNSNGKDWTRYALVDGNDTLIGSTFDASLLSDVKPGNKVDVTREKKGEFWNLTTVKPAEVDPIAARTSDGEADWDLIGLRKTRCHLWGSYLAGDALKAALDTWVSNREKPPGELEIANFVTRLGRTLVIAAETDTYHRLPTREDEDVPFG